MNTYNIEQLPNKRGVMVKCYWKEVLEVTWKVGTRIWILISTKSWICKKWKNFRRRKGSNCFLTANYVWFWETSWLWKLKDVLNWKYSIPSVDFYSASNIEDAEEKLWFPFYGVCKNKHWEELHAFIILWKKYQKYLCFHQRWDSWIYEIITFNEILSDWSKKTYHEWYWLETYAQEYSFTEL